jgi:hypothetical protein
LSNVWLAACNLKLEALSPLGKEDASCKLQGSSRMRTMPPGYCPTSGLQLVT